MTTLVIDKNINAIYLHIPKTAGTSISNRIIDAVDPGRDRSIQYNWKNISVEHNGYKEYFKHPLLGTVYNDLSNYSAYNVFTTVRNPWARALSGYQDLLVHYTNGRNDLLRASIDELIEMNGSFPDFNKWIELLPNTVANVSDDWNLKTPQTEWLSPKVDVILKQESLSVEFDYIKSIFKIDKPLDVLNKSKMSFDYREVYSDSSKRIISKLFESDIDAFKYVY
jgi:hypothetical protein